MLKRRLEISENKDSKGDTQNEKKRVPSPFRLRISEDSEENESSSKQAKDITTSISKQEINSSSAINQDYLSWIKTRLLNDLVKSIQDYDFLKVYSVDEWGKKLPDEKFVHNLLKAFFKKEDLEKFKENLNLLIAQEITLQEYQKEIDNLKTKLKLLKEENQKLKSTTVSKKEVIKILLKDFDGKIKELLEEEATQAETEEFIVTFIGSFRDLLTTINLVKEKEEEEKLEIIYQVASNLLKSISGLYVANRRRILSNLAELLSDEFEKYKFISAEDYTFVDPKIHNIVLKKGQKIKEALSFCVIKKEGSQTIKYADVITL